MIHWFNISKALAVRCLLAFHVWLTVWRVTVTLQNTMFWLLLCILLPLVCESFYTVVRRQGREFSRFTPCFFFYLGAVLPGIWLLELERTDQAIEGRGSQISSIYDSTNVAIPGTTQNIWLVVIEEMMPYVIFVSRWILPRGSIKRVELAELLFSFIGIGGDIMEFFSLIDEDVIRKNRSLAYVVLSIWTLSVMQFTMTVTVIHNPKSEKNVRVVVELPEEEKEWQQNKHEIYAIFLSMSMQDLPFSIMRLYTIINFNRINYSLIFFTSKNLLIIALLLYKVATLCQKRHSPNAEDDEEVITDSSGREVLDAERATATKRVSTAGSLAGSLADEYLHNANQNTTNEDPYISPISRSLSGLKKRNGILKNNDPISDASLREIIQNQGYSEDNDLQNRAPPNPHMFTPSANSKLQVPALSRHEQRNGSQHHDPENDSLHSLNSSVADSNFDDQEAFNDLPLGDTKSLQNRASQRSSMQNQTQTQEDNNSVTSLYSKVRTPPSSRSQNDPDPVLGSRVNRSLGAHPASTIKNDSLSLEDPAVKDLLVQVDKRDKNKHASTGVSLDNGKRQPFPELESNNSQMEGKESFNGQHISWIKI